MTRFDGKYFGDFKFTQEQVKKNFDNALKDLHIAEADKIAEVKFSYAYQALIKGGIALASFHASPAFARQNRLALFGYSMTRAKNPCPLAGFDFPLKANPSGAFLYGPQG